MPHAAARARIQPARRHLERADGRPQSGRTSAPFRPALPRRPAVLRRRNQKSSMSSSLQPTIESTRRCTGDDDARRQNPLHRLEIWPEQTGGAEPDRDIIHNDLVDRGTTDCPESRRRKELSAAKNQRSAERPADS
jgi:hypothetical protein